MTSYQQVSETPTASSPLLQKRKRKPLYIAAALVSVIAIALVLAFVVFKPSKGKKSPDEAYVEAPEVCSLAFRVDCEAADEDSCLEKGCCWAPADREGEAGTGNGQYPKCFKKSGTTEYKVIEANVSTSAVVLKLENTKGVKRGGADVQHLLFSVAFERDNRIRVRVEDADNARYEIPDYIVQENVGPDASATLATSQFVFNYTESPFAAWISRASGEILFDTRAKHGEFTGLVFKDQLLEISTQLSPASNLYGLGERVHHLRLSENYRYTLFALDIGVGWDSNLYGTQPFVMDHRPGDGGAHGLLMRNSNAQDVTVVKSDKANEHYMTWRALGGILDFYLLAGPSPDDVAWQYQELVGFPTMPPYWAHGFQLCRYGFRNIEEVETVVQKMKDHKLPFDAQYIDIEYMEEYKDFTWDEVNFPVSRVKGFVDKLHAEGFHLVLILDPAIEEKRSYSAYETGMEQNIFIKNDEGDLLLGQVWPPGPAAFPNFLNPNATAWWRDEIDAWFTANDFKLDGVWIDMNEVANFCHEHTPGVLCIDQPGAILTNRDDDAPRAAVHLAFDAANSRSLTREKVFVTRFGDKLLLDLDGSDSVWRIKDAVAFAACDFAHGPATELAAVGATQLELGFDEHPRGTHLYYASKESCEQGVKIHVLVDVPQDQAIDWHHRVGGYRARVVSYKSEIVFTFQGAPGSVDLALLPSSLAFDSCDFSNATFLPPNADGQVSLNVSRSASAYGTSLYVASNASASGDCADARVELFVLPPFPDPHKHTDPAPVAPPKPLGPFTVRDPPYAINNRADYMPLGFKTLDMNATHDDAAAPADWPAAPEAPRTFREYDVHSLYGLAESIATVKALDGIATHNHANERHMVLSRSTFTGSGRWIGHWLGDNDSSFKSMADSIIGSTMFGLYGVPYVGPDTCGFFGSVTDELCVRWSTMGAFYPFSRNHNFYEGRDQWPYVFTDYVDHIREALLARYALIPYYDANFFHLHRHGAWVHEPEKRLFPAMVMQALFNEFPNDPELLNLGTQFLIGRHVLVSPILEEGAVERQAYFPATEAWYDWWTLARVQNATDPASPWVTLAQPLGNVSVHVRGGAVIPLQPAGDAMNTVNARLRPYTLLVTHPLDDARVSEWNGRFFADDGISKIPESGTGQHLEAFYKAAVDAGKLTLEATASGAYQTPAGAGMDAVTWVGIPSDAVSAVQVAGRPDPHPTADWTFEAGVLKIVNLGLTMHGSWEVEITVV